MCNIYIGGLDSKIENFYHLSHSVSLEFRNLVFQTYNLALPEDVHFLAYLLFTSFRDISSRHPVTSREVLAENYRAQKALRQGRFRAMPTLTEFQSRTGVQLEVTEYKLHERKARTALPLLTFELELLLQRDAAENVQEVVFVSGDVCNERWVKRERAKRRARRAAVDAELNFERENAHVARLLNSLPSNAFADYSKNIQRARKYVLSNMVGLKRNHQLRILNELQVYFAPAYRQVPNSERLFPIGNSAVYLTRKVRAILFDTRCPTGTCCMTRISCENGNCRKAATIWKADLSNAHLVIAARLWGLEGILSLLKREKSIWPYLLRELQLTLDAKDDLKEIIYATVYGMHETNVKGMITREFGREVTDRYFRLELIAQLFAAREIHMSRIKNDGFICDAFGKKHFLSDVSRGSPLPEEEKGAEDKAVRTLVSHEVGSYELRVMAAASKIVKDAGREVVIILWLHDGIYVKFKDTRKSRMDTWKKRIKHAVEAEARALNLPLILVDE